MRARLRTSKQGIGGFGPLPCCSASTAGQADESVAVEEDAYDGGAAADFAVAPLLGIVRAVHTEGL